MREYNTARTIFSILEFVAWVAVAGGLILAVVGATASTGFSRSAAGVLGAVPGLIMAFIGIIAVATVQFYRAGVDAAENSGKSLEIAKEQLRLQKSALRSSSETGSVIAKPAAVTEAKSTTNLDLVSISPQPTDEGKGANSTEAQVSKEHRYKIEHNGEILELIRGKVVWGEHTFDSIDAAREYVSSTATSGRSGADNSNKASLLDRTKETKISDGTP